MCAKDCGSETGQYYDWIDCLKKKWENSPQITGLADIDIGNITAAVPIDMLQQVPSQEDQYPLRPGLTETELRNCKIYRNRCACSVNRLRLEHKIKELELAEKFYYKCAPFNGDRPKEKFLAECDRLKGQKPPVDKCGVVGGRYFYKKIYRDYCRKCN